MNFKTSEKIVLLILFGLCLLNVFAWTLVFDLEQDGFLEIIFFDIGQGDAVLIKTAEKHYILIDGGPDSKILEKLSQETYFFKREIDLIVLTHFHSDHFSGLEHVLKAYNVNNILWNGALDKSPGFEEWQKLISESGAEIIIASFGQKIRGKDFFIEVFHPFVSLEGAEIKDQNLSSIVLRLVFKDNSFLFMADAYKSIEKELIKKQDLITLDSNVLKVSHHGSKTSTSEEFVMAISPETAVISVGKNNKYNHPNKETLDILEKYDIKVFRTDLDGDIKIISNGTNYAISNF